ncbi:DNA-directed primase/polymerase protein-like isoform X2 [Branchiostoma floridae x Branchiostoma belcheri]
MSSMSVKSGQKRSLDQEKEWRKIEWKKKLRRFERAEEEMKKFPLGPQYKPGLRCPSPVWRLFPRQKLAFDFARCCKQDVHVFSCEVEGESEQGQRKYLVTTYEQFWDMYSVLHPDLDGHFYEVIPEGATCHLHFDLEFSRVVNPGSDGVTMVGTLIRYVCWFLKKKYDLDCTEEHVLDLESSTEEKFSRHLIFHLPGAAFQDNIHAGNFVHEMCDKLYQHTEQQRPHAGAVELQELAEAVPGLDQLFVNNKDGERVLFIDTGVYTKNRNFRLYKNTKLGRRAPLLVAPTCKYRLQHSSKACWDKQVFLDSLVSNVRFSSDLKVLRCEHMKGLTSRVRTSCGDGNNSSGRDNRKVEGQLSGCSSSPYPEVDTYVVLQACRGGVQGAIRQWTYFSQGEVLMYDISHNRWCENIGRAHRSNHVMLVADLKRCVMYQKCHDPVCRAQNYKSTERPLPSEILPAFILEEDELWDSGLEDEDLLSALSSQEQSYTEIWTDSDPDADGQELSDQDLLAASDLATMIAAKRDRNFGTMTASKRDRNFGTMTAAKCEGNLATVTASNCQRRAKVDSWEVSDDDLLLAANHLHSNNRHGNTHTTVAVTEQGSRHVGKDSGKIETTTTTVDNNNRHGNTETTTVDNCDVSDEDLLLAATQCC